jgi:hypothetical protein
MDGEGIAQPKRSSKNNFKENLENVIQVDNFAYYDNK